MAVIITAKKRIVESEYNQALNDGKEDFILDELELKRKVDVIELVSLPVISGAEDINYLINYPAPDYLDGVTAHDIQEGDITDRLIVDDSDVDLTIAGEYDLIYSVKDSSSNETTVTVTVFVDGIPEYTITYEVNPSTVDYDTSALLDKFTDNDLPLSVEVTNIPEGYWLEAVSDMSDTEPVPLEGNTFTIDQPGDITLELSFQALEYTITYNLDGGDNDPGNPETFTIENLPVYLGDASKPDHTFNGWFTEDTFENEVTEIGSIGDITLYAKFTAN